MSLPDISAVPHFPAVQELTDILVKRTRSVDRSFFQAAIAYYLGKIASSMRAVVSSQDRGLTPVNIYSMALAPSGFGKGTTIELMESTVLRPFEERYLEDTFRVISEQNLWVIANKKAAQESTDQQETFDKIKREFDQKGHYAMTFSEATAPAIKEMRAKLLMGGIGSINLQVDEIGLNLTTSMEPLILFLELYDHGKVKIKLVKNTNENPRSMDLSGQTPTNMLLFGAPAKLFDGAKVETEFYGLLETGYARRCIFGIGSDKKEAEELTGAQLFDKLVTPQNEAIVDKWSGHFYKLADPSFYGQRIEMSKDVAILLLDYQLDCEAKAKAMGDHQEIQKSEMAHRHSKALKLAGAYAFIDESPEVKQEHLLAAIKLVEESGSSFENILSRDKPYVKLARYIAQVPTEQTHADLDQMLPFYPKSSSGRNDMISLATAWGWKNHVIIKKSLVDGIEFFKGEALKETDLSKMRVSYSKNWAYEYLGEEVPFEQLHAVTQAQDYHWANHHFRNGHRCDENTISGFNMIAIDMDGGMPAPMACELVQDYKYLIYTTKSHTDQEHRYRMVFPINYFLELDQEEYREFMNSIMEWLPFPVATVDKGKVVTPGMDPTANQRSKKWSSHPGQYHYNLEGKMLDILPFIPRTRLNEIHQQRSKDLASLDNLERWFAGRIGSGNRNNQMIKYALCLVDAGYDLTSVRNQVHAFNKKLQDPMSEQEIDATIMVTVAKKYQKVA